MASILIVDDLATNREVLVNLLRYRGHQLFEATDGKAALAAVRSERIDLVITDVLMPEMDGYELVRQIRLDPATRSVAVIFYTAHYGARDARELALSSGVAHVLSKPIEAEDVLRVVDHVLSGGSPGESQALLTGDFDREHLRLLTDKLSENVADLRDANVRLRALINIGLELGSERNTEQLLQKVCADASDLFGATSVGLLTFESQFGEARHVIYGASALEWAEIEQLVGDALRATTSEGRAVRGDASRHGGVGGDRIDRLEYIVAPLASPAHLYGWMCLVRHDGRPFTVEDEQLLTALGGQVGRVYENGHFYAVATRRASELEREIRERREAEDALRAADERTRFALESANVGIWDMDGTAGVLRWSEVLESQFGLEPGTFPGTFGAFIHCVHPDDRDATVQAIQDATTTGKDFVVQHRALWPDGTVRWLNGAGRSIFDESGKFLRAVGISLDVTARRSLEEQFRHAQKMEAIGRLAGGVAHDFNNLLSVVLSYSELLLQELSPGTPMWLEISEIKQAGERATALTRQLLAFSRQQVIEPTVVVLNDVVGSIRNMMRRLVREDVEVVERLSDDLGRCLCDPGQMEQVVMNLVVNASDAMPDGGTLTIETANADFDEDYASVHLGLRPGPYVMLAVSDTGIGMDKVTESRVFEPFFTTKPKGKGTGLGLSTVFGIVDQSSGRVHVYSELGRGTTFKVYLPRTDAALEIAPQAPAATDVRGSETVLLVEDETEIRAVVCGILRRHGYQVLEARSPQEAVSEAERYSGSFDLLLTDVVMPHMSGKDLAERLGLRHPSMKVLFMSGYTDGAVIGQLPARAAFLQKPVTPSLLLRKVRDVLDGHAPREKDRQ